MMMVNEAHGSTRAIANAEGRSAGREAASGLHFECGGGVRYCARVRLQPDGGRRSCFRPSARVSRALFFCVSTDSALTSGRKSRGRRPSCGHLSSPSWDTSTTARRLCLTLCETQPLQQERPEESLSTSEHSRSRSSCSNQEQSPTQLSPSSTHLATRRSRQCELEVPV